MLGICFDFCAWYFVILPCLLFTSQGSSVRIPKCMQNVALPKLVNPLNFFNEVRDELKKVVWPTKDETIRLTGIVIGISVIVALFIGAADYIFTMLLGLIIKR